MTMSAGATPFPVGATLGRSFAILSRNILPFGALGLLFTAPIIAFNRYVMTFAPDKLMVGVEYEALSSEENLSAVGWAIGIILGFLFVYYTLTLIATGAMCYGTFEDLRGQRAWFGQCLTRGLAVVFPVLVVATASFVGVLLGLVLLVVPGLMLYMAWWVAIPAAVVERPGIVASLRRSAFLTKGNRWRIFGLFLVVLVIIYGVAAIPELIFASFSDLDVYNLASWVTTALTTAFSAVVGAVSYYHLRQIKEGVDIDEIARVFD